jgi:hypothetical protein
MCAIYLTCVVMQPLPTLLCLAIAVFGLSCATEPTEWYRGNLHTHTFWSDGDDFPESVVAWYRDAGYDFVAISDHNTLADREKWVEITEGRREAYEHYASRFGSDVSTRERGDTLEVRLATFQEYAGRLAVEGEFLVIQAEELSDGFDGKPLHVNATNLRDRIEPQHGTSVTDVLQRNIDAVLAQRDSIGVPIMAHVNHPNFVWAVSPDDLVPLVGEHFFEVYNGHPLVHNYGEGERPGTEAMWDYVNARRLASNRPLLYGLAVDDAHNYFDVRVGKANPGRGWVMVKADALSPDALIPAMERGDFYASSGVSLAELEVSGDRIRVLIEPEDGVAYETVFLGVRRSDASGATTEFARVSGPEASYEFDRTELFVRATILSTRLMDNPFVDGETEKAWTQPVAPR